MRSEPTEDPRLSIPDWNKEDRPREKFSSKGPESLTDTELIAILFRTGTATESAVDLAKRTLKQCHNQLNELADFSIDKLMTIKGIGPAKAITLQAAFELGRRVRVEQVLDGSYIRSSSDAFEVMRRHIAHLKHEEFWVIYLNQSAKILDVEQISKGGITNTIVDVRIIFQKALTHEATAIIVCHNHPSGSLNPSPDDIQLTHQIEKAANILNIKLLDHIIIHKGNYYSFQEQGKL